MARLRKPSRGKAKRPLKPRVIVVTEGEKTEPQYIYEFLRIHGAANVHVEPTGFDPKGVVERAIALKRGANANRRDTSRTRVWAVFDRDDHDQKRFKEARWLAKKSGIGVAISNPCFELWAIYHYRDHAGRHIERDKCQRTLEGLCAGYSARRGKLFNDIEVIRDNHDAAVQRAIRSLRDREAEGDPHGNPSTSMHLLMENIRSQAEPDDAK